MADMAARLAPDDFYLPKHAEIFDAMLAVHTRQSVVDLITVAAELGRTNSSVPTSELGALQELAGGGSGVDDHVTLVAEAAALRRLHARATEIASQAHKAAAPAQEILDAAEWSILSVGRPDQREGGLTPLSRLVEPTLADALAAEGACQGVRTGFPVLDEMTGGLQKGNLIIMAGRPSLGKTSFAMNIATNAALADGATVAVFSLEMRKQQLIHRMLAGEAEVEVSKIRSGKLDKADKYALEQAAAALKDAEIHIDDTWSLTVGEMKSRCRRIAAKGALDLIIVDYLQLMRGVRRTESRQVEITEISSGLKGLAKEMDAPLIAVSQLSRALVARGGDYRPMLSDLRDSGSLEQDADVVIFVHRKEMFDPTAPPGEAEIIVGKQRNGPVGTFPVMFDEKYTRFRGA